jgi:hypothetical protein
MLTLRPDVLAVNNDGNADEHRHDAHTVTARWQRMPDGPVAETTVVPIA